MKTILLTLFVFLNITFARDPILNSSPTPFIDILAVGEKISLNTINTNFDKQLSINLYALPSKQANNCFPESHGICQYEYYVTSSQLDDSPINNLYFLGTLGEVFSYQWEVSNQIDTAIIILKANKYSDIALKYNKSLINKVKTYRYRINATKLVLISSN